MITKICKTCGKEFKVFPYRKDTADYCSISCSKKGQVSWNKSGLKNKCIVCGKEFDVYPSIKDSKFCSHKCYWKSLFGVHKETSTTFKKGNIPPYKGKNQPQISRENHWNWKGGITPENHRIRTSLEMKLWRKSCFERDNFTCQKCGQIGGELRVHHINNFADFPELRLSIDNGITLCKHCHTEFHHKYGVKNNTHEQLNEFLNI